jgi:hypothetical protein
MKAIEAPIFLNLDKARQWVNLQSLDETFYLVGTNHPNALPVQHKDRSGWTVYEFFNAEEFLSVGEGAIRPNGVPQREHWIVEAWS